MRPTSTQRRTPTRPGIPATLRGPPPPPADRTATLGRILRAAGATIVAASAGTFVLQQWQGSDDLTRYFALLAQAAVLSGAGFVCAVRIGESKSARTFMALAAGMLPALFAVLGGLVYSQLGLDPLTREVAGYATWRAPSAAAALAATAATLVAAVPIAFLSFLSLARSQARALTGAFLALGSAMLVPTRQPDVTAALVALALAGIAALEWLRWQRDPAMRTREGLVVRGMLVLPVALIVGRSLIHYEASLYLAAIGCFAIGGLLQVCRFAIEAGGTERSHTVGLELASWPPLALGFMTFAVATEEAFGIADGLVIPMAVLPFTGLLVAASLRQAGGVAERYRGAAVGIALAAMAANLAFVSGMLAAFTALAVGVVALAYGYFFDRRPMLVGGAVVAGWALVAHVKYAIQVHGPLSWTSLSLLGIGVIFAASFFERLQGRRAGRAAWRRDGEAAGPIAPPPSAEHAR